MRTDRQAGRALSRREFLRLAGMAGVATPLASAVFASCSNGGAGTTTATGAASSFGSGGIQVAGVPYPLARPDAPVTWNLHPDNPAIRSGLAPESRMLKVIGYPDSVYQLVLDEFQTRYSTKVEWYDVSTPEEMLARVQPDPSAFDLICAAALDQVGTLVAGRLIQPVNHSYLSNFGNIWSSYQDPFYDRRDRYTVPYTVYTTGIVWRNDLVSVDISSMLNPYEIFWDTAYKGKVRVLSGSRDLVSLGLLRDGESDVNTGSKSALDSAGAKLLEGARSMKWKFDDLDYEQLTVAGEWLIHQTWSGQVASYVSYLPTGLPITKFSYLWPPRGAAKSPGLLQNDVFAITKGASSPVLAHKLVDLLLDPAYSLLNYGYAGYQPPLNSIDPDSILAKGLIPPNLESIIITEDMVALGVAELELSPSTALQYESLYRKIVAGGGA